MRAWALVASIRPAGGRRSARGRVEFGADGVSGLDRFTTALLGFGADHLKGVTLGLQALIGQVHGDGPYLSQPRGDGSGLPKLHGLGQGGELPLPSGGAHGGEGGSGARVSEA